VLARISRLRKATLIYPIRPVPRCAVLVAGFRSRPPVRVFEQGWNEDAAKFQPQAIAATLEQLEALAGGVVLTHAVIVFRRPDQPRLNDAERDRLWRSFRVPSFEQIIAEDGTLLASECEAHAGLHIESAKLAVGSAIDDAVCGCGRMTPRLIGAEPTEALRRVAAYAR
jgi:hypothetical protein